MQYIIIEAMPNGRYPACIGSSRCLQRSEWPARTFYITQCLFCCPLYVGDQLRIDEGLESVLEGTVRLRYTGASAET